MFDLKKKLAEEVQLKLEFQKSFQNGLVDIESLRDDLMAKDTKLNDAMNQLAQAQHKIQELNHANQANVEKLLRSSQDSQSSQVELEALYQESKKTIQALKIELSDKDEQLLDQTQVRLT